MTSKTSLFNKGIYKSTVRRFIWGAVLYAIALFMCTGLPILSSVNPENSYRLNDYVNAMLLADEFLIFPLFFTIVVPTAAALLVFRFVHSKRTTIFIHSLPVSRTANYISTLAAAFTLMFAPVILNGIILSVISLCGYSELFNLTGVAIWTGYNLLGLFLMFSAATFVAFLTGNTFAAIGLNILIHLIAPIFTGCFTLLAEPFLYGYVNSNILMNTVNSWNFVTYIMNRPAHFLRQTGELLPFDWVGFTVFMLFAIAFYIFAWLLYRKRRTETAEDVAAYSVLNPIFKYLISFICTLGACGIGCLGVHEAPALPAVLAIIVGAVVYFALEMMLRKSFRVFGAYKGYLGVLAAVALTVFVFAGTPFFGFEGRVPEISEVEAVTVEDYRPYGNEAKFSSSPAVVEYAVNMHRELAAPEMRYTVRNSDAARTYSIYIRYKLKGGKELERSYDVDKNTYYMHFSSIFEAEGFRESFIDIFSVDENAITAVDINHYDINELSQAQRRELLSCIREDVKNMSYYEYLFNGFSKAVGFRHHLYGDEYTEERKQISINANFEKTVAWLCANGYEDILLSISSDFMIIEKSSWDKYMEVPEIEDVDTRIIEAAYAKESPKVSDFADHKVISSPEEKKALRSYLLTHGGEFDPNGEPEYYVCVVGEDKYLNIFARIYEKEYVLG